jgi:L-ascorbate metabolism protein UlaG (beta-lactamase superfamily)
MANLKGTTVTWLGHSVVLVETGAGTKVLIDPFVKENPKFPKDYELPEKLDLILATQTKAPVVAMFELAAWFESKGVKETIPMGYGGSFTHKDVTVSMTQARHSSGIQDGDKFVYGAEPAGFVLTIEDGPVLYHAGDTDVFSDMQLIRDLYEPEIGMLPIGGHFTMDPRGAALAAKFLRLKAVLPLHWGTMPQLTGTPEQLEKHLGDIGIEVLKLSPGESVR